MIWSYWVCVQDDPDTHGGTTCSNLPRDASLVVSSLFGPLWGNLSVLLAHNVQKHVMHQRLTGARHHTGRLRGALWALDRRAKSGDVAINLFHANQIQPVCRLLKGRPICALERFPLAVWGLLGALLLVCLRCLRSSLSALVREDPAAIDIFDVWRVIMTVFVVYSHIVEANAAAPPVLGLPSLGCI